MNVPVSAKTFKGLAAQKMRQLNEIVDSQVKTFSFRSSIFDAGKLRQRLVQIFNSENFPAFQRLEMAEFNRGQFNPNVLLDRYPFPAMQLMGSGKLTLNTKVFFQNIFTFWPYWTHSLLFILKPALARNASRKVDSASLLTDPGALPFKNAETLTEFENFCTDGPIPFTSAGPLYVQTRARTSLDGRFRYCRFPLHSLYADSAPGFRAILAALLKHLRAVLEFHVLAIRFPLASYLHRDFAWAALAWSLDQRRVRRMSFLTDAYYSSQELVFDGLANQTSELHFVWTSQNGRDFNFIGEENTWDYPHRRLMRMRHSWHWTSEFSDWVQSFVPGVVPHAIGPVVWRLPDQGPTPPKKRVISIFDIMPAKIEWQRFNGWAYNYYNLENATAFIRDIVEAVGEWNAQHSEKYEVHLKHKRSSSPLHETRYFDAIDRTLAEFSFFKLIPSEQNIFELIQTSAVTLVAPFSSPAIIGLGLGTPSAFYDGGAEISRDGALNPSQIPLVRGRRELKDYLERHLSGVEKNPVINHP